MKSKDLSLLLLAGVILNSGILFGTTLSSQEQIYKIGGYRQDGIPSVITLEPSLPILSQNIEKTPDLRQALGQGAYELLISTEFQKLLGTRQGTDEIELSYITTTMLGYHVIFKQFYRSGDQKIPVLGQITVNIDVQGRAMGVTNNMEGGINVDADSLDRVIGARNAIEIAAGEYRARGEVLPSELPSERDAKLVLRRVAQFGMKSERESGKQKAYRDELVYSIPFARAGAPDLAGNMVVVEAMSGKVLQFEDTASREFEDSSSARSDLVENPESTSGELLPATPPPVSTNPVPSGPVFYSGLVRNNCFDGTGVDRFGYPREFPTSSFPGSTTIDDYYSVSCDELVWIYKLDPSVTNWPNVNDINGQFKDYTSLYLDKTNVFQNPSVVDVGFWCNQLLAYFEDRGYTHRKAVDANEEPIRIEIHVKPDAVDSEEVYKSNTGPEIYKWTNAECLLYNFTQLKGYLKGNGMLRFGAGNVSEGYYSCTDPQLIAHEFFHSVIFDQIAANSGVIPSKEFKSMNEGFCDVFAMLFSRFVITATQPTFLNIGESLTYPFHIGSRRFTDIKNKNRGRPNLQYPRDPALYPSGYLNLEFAVWHAARIVPDQTNFINPNNGTISSTTWAEHDAATLVSEWAYLMVAGSGSEKDCPVKKTTTPNKYATMPVEPWVNAPVAGNYSFAHNDQDTHARWERLEEFFLTLIHSGNLAPNMSFYQLRDLMVAWANSFVKSGNWPTFNGLDAGERVQQAFALLGFGNGVESDEPHTFETIMTNPIASQNLISVGYGEGRHLPITFHLKPGQISYFVLNEKLYMGDSIEFSVENKTGNDNAVDIRFYADEAVNLDEPEVTGADGANTCSKKYLGAMKYQMYPAVGFCGEMLNKPAAGVPPEQSGSFVLTTFNRCDFPNKPAGINCSVGEGGDPDNKWHSIYVGVKTAEIAGGCACDTDYILTVKVQRAEGNKRYWDEFP